MNPGHHQPLHQHHTVNLPGRRLRGAAHRKSAPKVRTGCITCKKRKVRCDETKPTCRNCDRVKGIICEGYDAPKALIIDPQQKKFEHDESKGSNDLMKSIAQRPARPVILAYGTDEESRSLSHYIGRTSKIMSQRSDPYFWSTLLIQAAWENQAVKACLTAMSQVNEWQQARRNARETGTFVPNLPEKKQRALISYSSAVRLIMQAHKPDLESILICCIVLYAFENFMNNLQNAGRHLDGAVGLIEEWRRGGFQITSLTLTKHVIPMIEGGREYHRISMQAGQTAWSTTEPVLAEQTRRVLEKSRAIAAS